MEFVKKQKTYMPPIKIKFPLLVIIIKEGSIFNNWNQFLIVDRIFFLFLINHSQYRAEHESLYYRYIIHLAARIFVKSELKIFHGRQYFRMILTRHSVLSESTLFYIRYRYFSATNRW